MQALYDAIQDAGNNYDHLFVAAAGNSGQNMDIKPDYPAGYKLPNVVAVGNTYSSDILYWNSNYGPETVQIAAPGVSILSTELNNWYSYMTGTSMSCPHVSGAAALLRAQDSSLKYGEVKAYLLDGADVIPALNGLIGGSRRLNVLGALNLAKPPSPPPPPPPPPPSPTGNSVVGVNLIGEIYYTDNIGLPSWVRVWGELQTLSMSGKSVVGVNSRGEIYYTADITSPSWVRVWGKLQTLSMSGKSVVGVNSIGQIYYTADIRSPSWTKVTGDLQILSMSENSVVGVNSIGEIYYTQDVTSPAWVRVLGTLQTLSMSA